MHLLVGHLFQDSTFYLFEFLSNFFSKIKVSKLRVQLICECGLYTGASIHFPHPASKNA